MKFGWFPPYWYQVWPLSFAIWVIAWFIGQIIELAVWARGAMKDSGFFDTLPPPPREEDDDE